MPIYKQTTEITNIDDLLSSVERDIEEVYFGNKNVFTVWGEYDGTLPAQYSANGSVLADYRVYGANGGVGDRTKQLFNAETAVYKNGVYKNDSGIELGYPGAGYYETYIPIAPNKTIYVTNVRGSLDLTVRLYFYDAQKQWISRTDGYVTDFSVAVPSNTAYVQLQISQVFISSPNSITITQDSATEYVPYGYVIPMGVSGNVNIDKNDGLYGYTIRPQNNTIYPNNDWWVSGYIPVAEGATYTGSNIGSDLLLYSEIGGTATGATGLRNGYTIPQGVHYMRMNVTIMYMNTFTVSAQYPSTPIYFGDEPLGEDEYISYSEQKVYRRTENLYNGAKDIKNQLIYPNNGYGQYTTDYDSSDYIPISEGTYTISLYNDKRYDVLFRVNFYQSPSVLGYQNNLIDTKILNGYAEHQISIAQSGYIRIGFSHYTHARMLNIGEAIAYQPYLQPTDPPVPLPALPTVDGVTITDYAGQSSAPSRFYAKYRKEGF